VQLVRYMLIKRKKMNLQMMQLIDCINANGALDDELLEYIAKVSRVIELRAVAYKDLQSTHKVNNLYNYWHMHMLGRED